MMLTVYDQSAHVNGHPQVHHHSQNDPRVSIKNNKMKNK